MVLCRYLVWSYQISLYFHIQQNMYIRVNYVEKKEEERATRAKGMRLNSGARKQGELGERAGVGQGKRERGRKPSSGRKRQVGKERQRWKEKLLRIQSQACTIQPLRMGRMHTAWGNLGALETAMGGLKNSNADAIAHKATHYIGFWSHHPINR